MQEYSSKCHLSGTGVCVSAVQGTALLSETDFEGTRYDKVAWLLLTEPHLEWRLGKPEKTFTSGWPQLVDIIVDSMVLSLCYCTQLRLPYHNLMIHHVACLGLGIKPSAG